MQTIPEAVKRTFEDLKANYPFYIIMLVKNGHYYIYRQQGAYQKETRTVKTIRTYLGKITTEGEFLRRSVLAKDDIERAKAIIIAHGGRVIMPKFEPASMPSFAGINDTTDIKIIRALSTDARQGIAKISKTVGVAQSTVRNRIEKLESKYGIRYTLEYGFLDRFNLYRFLVIAKFNDETPNSEEVRALLEAEPQIQLALWTKGAYNLFLFVLASTPTEAENLVYKLRSQPELSRFSSEWYSSYFTHGYGYIPLRDEFFELIKDRVWHRTKETPRRQQGQLFKREYAVLRGLSSNGLVKFRDIDEKYGLPKGSASSAYHELIKSENIWRTTITMKSPPLKDIAVFTLEQFNIEKFNNNKNVYIKHMLDNSNNPLNKYLYVGDIGSPYGILLVAPIYKEGDLELLESALSHVAQGSRIKVSIVSSTLVGMLGLRKIDDTKTLWYKYWTQNKVFTKQ